LHKIVMQAEVMVKK